MNALGCWVCVLVDDVTGHCISWWRDVNSNKMWVPEADSRGAPPTANIPSHAHVRDFTTPHSHAGRFPFLLLTAGWKLGTTTMWSERVKPRLSETQTLFPLSLDQRSRPGCFIHQWPHIPQNDGKNIRSMFPPICSCFISSSSAPVSPPQLLQDHGPLSSNNTGLKKERNCS